MAPPPAPVAASAAPAVPAVPPAAPAALAESAASAAPFANRDKATEIRLTVLNLVLGGFGVVRILEKSVKNNKKQSMGPLRPCGAP